MTDISHYFQKNACQWHKSPPPPYVWTGERSERRFCFLSSLSIWGGWEAGNRNGDGELYSAHQATLYYPPGWSVFPGLRVLGFSWYASQSWIMWYNVG